MIPNIIHFIFGLSPDFGNRPFILFHYLAIKSAHEINKPDKIFFICAYEPEGEYFEKAKQYVEIVKVIPPESIFGNPLLHYAHKADVIRLERLMEYGGIYLDLDIICQKPLTGFLNSNKLQIATAYEYWKYEPRTLPRKIAYYAHLHRPKDKRILKGLCNAVMFAPAGDTFIKRWYETYRYFRARGHDLYWDEQSVQIPAKLAEIYRDEVTVLDDHNFFYPSFDRWGLKDLFENTCEFKDAYLFHLWESNSYEDYLCRITKDHVLKTDTTYNLLARKFLN